LSRRRELQLETRSFDPSEAALAVKDWAPHLLIVDMPVPYGPIAARDLLATRPNVNILAMNVPPDPTSVVAWAQSGVSGCVADVASLEEVVAALQKVIRSEVACSPSLAAMLFARASHVREAQLQDLTRREWQILDLVDRGLSNKEIGQLLHVEVSTVKNHTHRIFLKIGVHSRSEAAAWLRSSHRTDQGQVRASSY
jgi:two-component system, NarL family, nitrate/nitrite response regulator NarL